MKKYSTLTPTSMVLVLALTSAILMVARGSLIALASEADVQQSDESYFDDFAGYAVGTVPSGWTAYGTPEISPKVVTYGGTGSNYHRLEFPAYVAEQTYKWLVKDALTVGEATITVKLNFQTSSDGGGLVLGWQDSDNLIAVMPNPFWDEITVWEFVDGEVSRTWNSGGRNTVSIQTNQDYWLRVVTRIDETEGNQLLVYWSTDGSTFLEKVTANNVGRLKGQVGVGTYQFLSHTLFDDFHVEYVDIVPPAPIADLVAESGGSAGQVDLAWTAPGDDDGEGIASKYIVRYSETAIETEFGWIMATDVDNKPIPQPAGSTESMTVSGLTSGKTYYFAIRAEDEVGNTSGLSNSPQAVAKEARDLGFRPNPDGYKFNNPGSSASVPDCFDFQSSYSGLGIVCNGSQPQLEYRDLFAKYRSTFSAGICTGMASASLLYFTGASTAPGGEETYQLSFEQAWRDIAKYHGRQHSQAVYETVYARWIQWQGGEAAISQQVDAVYNEIKQSLTSESSKPILLDLFPQPAGGCSGTGHTITPFRIDDSDPLRPKVYVYENFKPGDDTRFIQFDFSSEISAFHYNQLNSIRWDSEQCGSLIAVPLSAFTSAQSQVPYEGLHVSTGGAVQPLMVNSGGGAIGYTDEGVLTNTVPGAMPIYPWYSPDEMPAVTSFLVPPDIYTTTLGNAESYALSVWSEFGTVELKGVASSTGNTSSLHSSATPDLLTINSTLDEVILHTDGTGSQPARLEAIQPGESESSTIVLDKLKFDGSGSLAVNVDSSSVQLQSANVATEYDLSLIFPGPQTSVNFQQADLVVGDGDTHIITFSVQEQMAQVTLEIDYGSDGTIDEAVILTEQGGLSLYLPLLVGP